MHRWRTAVAVPVLAVVGCLAIDNTAGAAMSLQQWQKRYGNEYRNLITDIRDVGAYGGFLNCEALSEDATRILKQVPPPPGNAGVWRKMVRSWQKTGESCGPYGKGKVDRKAADVGIDAAAILWTQFHRHRVQLGGFQSLTDIQHYIVTPPPPTTPTSAPPPPPKRS